MDDGVARFVIRFGENLFICWLVEGTSQQINKFSPKLVKNLATPSSIFIFVFSSFTGKFRFSQSEAMIVQ